MGRELTRAIFQHKPDQSLRDYHFIQSGDMRVDEAAVMINLSGQIGVAFASRLEDDLPCEAGSGQEGEGTTEKKEKGPTLEPCMSLWEAR